MNNKAEAFNKYCAEVMGWTIDPPVAHGGDCVPCHDLDGMPTFMCAYDDANQRHEVFDKLWLPEREARMSRPFIVVIRTDGIDQAEREFIWSTNDDK